MGRKQGGPAKPNTRLAAACRQRPLPPRCGFSAQVSASVGLHYLFQEE